MELTQNWGCLLDPHWVNLTLSSQIYQTWVLLGWKFKYVSWWPFRGSNLLKYSQSVYDFPSLSLRYPHQRQITTRAQIRRRLWKSVKKRQERSLPNIQTSVLCRAAAKGHGGICPPVLAFVPLLPQSHPVQRYTVYRNGARTQHCVPKSFACPHFPHF